MRLVSENGDKKSKAPHIPGELEEGKQGCHHENGIGNRGAKDEPKGGNHQKIHHTQKRECVCTKAFDGIGGGTDRGDPKSKRHTPA